MILFFFFFIFFFFFFNDTATTEIYTLSLHDALPISITPPNLNSMFSKYLKNIGVLIYFSSIHIQSLQYEYMPACCQHHTSLILVGETPATSLSRLPCGLSTGVCYRLPRKIMDHHWIDTKQNTTETALKNKYVILILNRL